jgi:hypothetical protein
LGRWFDDYELAFENREEAERCLRKLNQELGRLRLRLEPAKTKLQSVPQPSDDDWQQRVQTGDRKTIDSRGMVRYFDTAFRFRDRYPDFPRASVCVRNAVCDSMPFAESGQIAQSCLSKLFCPSRGSAKGIRLTLVLAD